jgi:hypothetical protein
MTLKMAVAGVMQVFGKSESRGAVELNGDEIGMRRRGPWGLSSWPEESFGNIWFCQGVCHWQLPGVFGKES